MHCSWVSVGYCHVWIQIVVIMGSSGRNPDGNAKIPYTIAFMGTDLIGLPMALTICSIGQCYTPKPWSLTSHIIKSNFSIRFILCPSAFMLQVVLRQVHWITPNWPWTPKGQRYAIYLEQLAPSPKYQSVERANESQEGELTHSDEGGVCVRCVLIW